MPQSLAAVRTRPQKNTLVSLPLCPGRGTPGAGSREKRPARAARPRAGGPRAREQSDRSRAHAWPQGTRHSGAPSRGQGPGRLGGPRWRRRGQARTAGSPGRKPRANPPGRDGTPEEGQPTVGRGRARPTNPTGHRGGGHAAPEGRAGTGRRQGQGGPEGAGPAAKRTGRTPGTPQPPASRERRRKASGTESSRGGPGCPHTFEGPASVPGHRAGAGAAPGPRGTRTGRLPLTPQKRGYQQSTRSKCQPSVKRGAVPPYHFQFTSSLLQGFQTIPSPA